MDVIDQAQDQLSTLPTILHNLKIKKRAIISRQNEYSLLKVQKNLEVITIIIQFQQITERMAHPISTINKCIQ